MLKNDPLKLNIIGLRRKFKNRLGVVNCMVMSYKLLPHMPNNVVALTVGAVGGCYAFHPHLSFNSVTVCSKNVSPSISEERH